MQKLARRCILVFGFLVSITTISAQKTQIYWYRAIAAIDNENLSEAKTWLDSAISQNPKNINYLLKQGEVLFLEEKFDSSLVVFQQAEKQKLGTASLWMAKIYAKLGKRDLAFSELKRHLEGTDKESEAKILLDSAFEPLKLTSEWNELWKTDWYTANERFFAEIEYLNSQSKWDEVIDLITKRLEKGSGNHLLFAKRGEALASIGSFRSAEADFTEAINRAKRNAEYYEWRANCRVKLKQFKGSLKDINKAIELSGGNPKCLQIRAETFSNLGNFFDAASDVKQYLTFYPNDIVAQYQLARFLYESANYLDALFALGKIIRSGQASVDCYELRGIIYTKSENGELANADFSKAIEMEPNRANLYRLRGETLIKQGKGKLGCNDLKRAKELGNFSAQELFYKYCRK